LPAISSRSKSSTPNGSRRLLTLYVNHLTSQFIESGESDPVAAAQRKADRRRRQAEKVAEVVERLMRPDSRFVVLGDMNDVPEADTLSPLTTSQTLNLKNALEAPMETRPAKADVPPPASKAWTHRFKEANQPARYELFDHIWLSPALASKQSGAWIDRRTKHGGEEATTIRRGWCSTSDQDVPATGAFALVTVESARHGT
jgi:predicted extracellular nuclease